MKMYVTFRTGNKYKRAIILEKKGIKRNGCEKRLKLAHHEL